VTVRSGERPEGKPRFRLGTTSFIYPGSWLHNVRRLAPRFEDIELLFFESEGDAAFPDADELEGLRACKQEHGLSYSLHTPLDASLASDNKATRAVGLSRVQRAIAVGQSLQPETIVVHVYLGDGEHCPHPPRDLERWRQHAAESLRTLIAEVDTPRTLCVEVLDYDFDLLLPVIEELGLSIAADIGHLVRDQRDELGALARYLPRTRVIQWHGTDPDSRDHRSLAHYPEARARGLLAMLSEADYAGVLTLEVFRPHDLEESLRYIHRLGLQTRQ
jgi:sugar phosphate isomerase/epimerase